MTLEMFDILILYKAIEVFLLFWLLALLFKWVLTFIFGEKGARVIGYVGYSVNFAIKKFTLSRIFKIEVYESNPSKLLFEHEETDRWDALFTSLVIVPMSIGLVLGTIIGTIGLLIEEQLVFVSILLYIMGFLIAVNSIPSYHDISELKKSSVKSIVIWFTIATLLCCLLAAITVPFIETIGVIVSVITGIILTSIFTTYIPFISDRMSSGEKSSLIGGTIDLDS